MSFKDLNGECSRVKGMANVKVDLTDWIFGVHGAMLDQSYISRHTSPGERDRRGSMFLKSSIF